MIAFLLLVAVTVFNFFLVFAVLGRILGAGLRDPGQLSPKCPPHSWSYKEDGRMKCDKCQRRPFDEQ